MGVARVTVIGSIAGQTTNNVLHFRRDIISPVILADLCVRVRDFFVGNPFSLNTQAHQSWNRVHAYEVGANAAPIDLSFSTAGSAGVSIDYTPTVAAVFQLKTDVGGRRGRGRFYMGGFGSAQMSNGLWATGPMVTLSACAAAIQAFWCEPANPNYKGNGWLLVLLGRNNNPADALTVVQVIARPMVGTLRRRQLGVGS